MCSFNLESRTYELQIDLFQMLISQSNSVYLPTKNNSNMATDGKFSTNKAPKPVGLYPHARRAGNLLFLSGVGPRTAGSDATDSHVPGLKLDKNGNFLELDFAAQCRSVFDNVRAILEESGSSWDNLIDVQVFLVNMKVFCLKHKKHLKLQMIHYCGRKKKVVRRGRFDAFSS